MMLPFALTLGAAVAAPAPATASPLYLWPRPKTTSLGQGSTGVVMSDDFFKLIQPNNALSSPLLTAAFARYLPLTFPHAKAAMGAPAAAGVTGLTLTVASLDEAPPTLSTDESYSLDIPDGSKAAVVATASAKTVYGALRALETFSQLVQYDFDAGAYVIAAGVPFHSDDAPRFPHRGLMIDTARHYQPLASIRAIIDSLPVAKLNVLHWHMVDDQSFPFEVKSHPHMWDAAYAPSQRYTQADVAGVVEYARVRGVRVMVEFDVPGHGRSWCTGEPDICPSTTCQTPLNVASNYTFDVIDDMLTEAAAIFPDELMHLGGDEVDTSCWSQTPSIAAWMRAQGVSADGAYAYFVQRAAAIATSKGRRPVQWSEGARAHASTSAP